MTQPTLSKNIALDVPRLIDTRLLVQSNSGGGKSWVLRRILEQTANRVQQIILDTEGEFSTLREKFDYVICAPQGADAIATPETAALLARRIRETRVSAVVDLYELKMPERRRFVRLFLEELIDAPKKFWYPALVVVDEAHLYCPEKGEAESAQAVIDLSSRGRKRGLCAALATQRLSKLHKDAAAELLNKLIGRTGLDVDVKRAADELGMSAREAMPILRGLDPGEFFAFGPALTKTPTRIQIGPVATTHPKSGDRQMAAPPPPSEKIKKLLADLADLPKEAAQEARTLADIKGENARLKRELAAAQRAQKVETRTIEQPVLKPSDLRRLQTAVDAFGRHETKASTAVEASIKALVGVRATVDGLRLEVRKALDLRAHTDRVPVVRPEIRTAPLTVTPPVRPRAPAPSGAEGELSRPQQRILDSLAAFEPLGVHQVKKEMLAAHSGASPRSSAYSNNLGRLRSIGLIDYPVDGYACLSDSGRNRVNGSPSIASLAELHESWYRILPRPQAEILAHTLRAYPASISKEDLAHAAGASPTSSAYSNNLGRLRTLGAIAYPASGQVRASDLMFPEALR